MNGSKTRCMKFDFFGILLIRFLFNDLLGELVLCLACASFKFQLNIVWASSWHDMFVCGVLWGETRPSRNINCIGRPQWANAVRSLIMIASFNELLLGTKGEGDGRVPFSEELMNRKNQHSLLHPLLCLWLQWMHTNRSRAGKMGV